MLDPDAPELAKTFSLQNILDQGAEVGLRARSVVPGGALIDLPHFEYDSRVAATAGALLGPAPAVYEGAFRAGAA